LVGQSPLKVGDPGATGVPGVFGVPGGVGATGIPTSLEIISL
jgi:hypothetical protein